jgi:hypothetical protein
MVQMATKGGKYFTLLLHYSLSHLRLMSISFVYDRGILVRPILSTEVILNKDSNGYFNPFLAKGADSAPSRL